MTNQFINKYINYFPEWTKVYNQGKSHKVIAKETGVPASAVYTYLKEMGLTRAENVSILKRGENNPKWKGDDVQVTALHAWVRRNCKKPALCQACGTKKAIDLANISNTVNAKTYTRDFENWEWLCRRCHMLKDGRLEAMVKRNESKRV